MLKSMEAHVRPSGIPAIGNLGWGTHFCGFYQTRDDLIESLVPYFQAGLANNEQCLWVACDPLPAEDAREMLRVAVPDLDRHIADGQIEIIEHADWYLRTGNLSAGEVLDGWLEREQRALANGRAGLRLTGNTGFLEPAGWSDFSDYEAAVNEVFRPRKIIAMCSYHLDRCDAGGVLDVVENHQFALARRKGQWALIESASLKLAKADLNRLNEQLEQRVLERTAALQAALSVREDFLSVASHELKTPLAALRLHVDSIVRAQSKRGLTPEELNGRLVKAQEQCKRLELLVNKLLDISRASRGDLAVTLADVDVADLARGTVDRFVEEARRAGCALQLTAESPVVVRSDALRFEQVLTNLLSNAVRYAPGGPVEVNVSQSPDTVTLSVRDHGAGIPEDARARIFERFTQLTPARNPGGFGLGLWIVRQIVDALGGTVDVRNADDVTGGGALFTVRLPRSVTSH